MLLVSLEYPACFMSADWDEVAQVVSAKAWQRDWLAEGKKW